MVFFSAVTFVTNFLFTPLLTHPQEPFQIFPLLNTNTLVPTANALGAILRGPVVQWTLY